MCWGGCMPLVLFACWVLLCPRCAPYRLLASKAVRDSWGKASGEAVLQKDKEDKSPGEEDRKARDSQVSRRRLKNDQPGREILIHPLQPQACMSSRNMSPNRSLELELPPIAERQQEHIFRHLYTVTVMY